MVAPEASSVSLTHILLRLGLYLWSQLKQILYQATRGGVWVSGLKSRQDNLSMIREWLLVFECLVC